MRQVLQHLRSGELELANLPAPQVRPGHVLIQTTRTLISAGTERMLVEFGKASLISKARSQPDKVKQVLDKIRTDGLMPTLETVFNRLDEPLPLGYCNVGRVLAVGPDVTHLVPGDRVVSNGAHAEIVCIPKTLTAKVPANVSDEDAAFTVLASIGLQGQRLIEPTLGEQVVVFGLGLIGLVALQLLQANGCDVLGIDVNPQRLALAEQMGAKTFNAASGASPVTAVEAWTRGRGSDAVLVTASAKTDDIMHQAAQMSRKRGRIVLVGVVGLNLRRSDFYEKELVFQVSCSYGPGRYDDAYEQAGRDYPLPFVRWTEQRNFEAVLGALDAGRVDVSGLITHRFPLDQAKEAYGVVSSDKSALGVILEYPEHAAQSPAIVINESSVGGAASGKTVVGVIGAGNYSKMTMLPKLAKIGANVKYVADLNPTAARHVGQKFAVGTAVTDYQQILQDTDVNAVMIAVGHSLHARFVIESLKAGKHAFVEKPLAMNIEEIQQILDVAAEHPDKLIMTGFNRRFSPHMEKISELLRGRSEPLCMQFTSNAGAIPADHWIQDPMRGGGRIIGEACHYIDLMVMLSGSHVVNVAARMVGDSVATRTDKMSIVLDFADGSIGTVNYLANGSKSYPKELMEIFSEGRVLRLDNFRTTRGWGFKKFSKYKTPRLDKGHDREFQLFVERCATGGDPLIPLADQVNVTLATFAAMTSASSDRLVNLQDEYGPQLAQAAGADTSSAQSTEVAALS